MITVHQFVPAWGLPDLSPFCIKINTYLKMAGLPHKVVTSDVRKAPRGKLPYIEDEGKFVSDSGHIIEHLKQRYGDPLDGHLTAQERAIGFAFQSMLEEHFYFVQLYIRFQNDAGWEVYKGSLAEYGRRIGVPGFLTPILLHQVRSKTKQQLHLQGTGRHSLEEVTSIGKRQLDAVSNMLGEKPFLLGEKPTSFDACIYAFLIGLLEAPIPSQIKDHGHTLANLSAYCQRMRERFSLGTGTSNPA